MSSLEKEIRFGKFQGQRFVPGVSQKQFTDILQYFTALGWKKTHTVDKVVSRTIGKNKSVRKIGNKYQIKENISTVNNPVYISNLSNNYGIRRVESRETNLKNGDIFNKANRTSEYAVTRDRTTFTSENKQLDLTFIPDTRQFHVELEYTNAQKLAYTVNRIKSILQNDTLYKSFVGSYMGPLYTKLSKDAFDRNILTKKNYSVTDKANGERYLLYINMYGMFSFVTRKLEFIHIPIETPRPDYADTLLDGEFINGTFYASDVLFAKEKDVRGQSLTKRLDTVYDILMSLRLQFLRMKTFMVEKGDKVYEYPGNKLTNFKSVYEASGAIWENRKRLQYKLDGLIFTPFDEPGDIFEWKSDDPLTIEELGRGPIDVIRIESIENYFESKEVFEKFLTYIYKNIKPGGRFIGTAKSFTTNKKLKFLGQKAVNFEKFTQVMSKWGFKLISSNTSSFVFQKV